MFQEQKQLFKKGRIYFNEYPDRFVVVYKIKDNIKIKKSIKKENNNQIFSFLLDLYFDYERDGKCVPTQDIALMLGISEASVRRILVKAKKKIKAFR